MSFSQIFDVSGSAMSAQIVRLNATASNLANVDSVAEQASDTYRARHPVFAAQLQQQRLLQAGESASVAVEGVPVAVLALHESEAEPLFRYEPDHPFANEAGMVAYPNISVVNEMADMISASRAFQLNVEVMNTAKTLAERILSLGQYVSIEHKEYRWIYLAFAPHPNSRRRQPQIQLLKKVRNSARLSFLS